MDIVLHAGAYFTEEDRLFKTLLRNQADFAKRGVAVPGPGKYRGLLRELMAALDEGHASPDARDVLLDAILDEAQTDRLLLSHAFLFGAPRSCLRDGRLYDRAPARVAHLSHIFAEDTLEICFAIRNPAAFLPAIFAHSPQTDLLTFLQGYDPRLIRWSDTFEAITRAAPNINLTLWCFEDMPIIWGEIIREMAGIEMGTKIIGGFDLISDIMTQEGMKRFRAYLKAHPGIGERHKRRVIEAFLIKFAKDEEIEEELEAPGWSEDLIEEITERYEDDILACARIPGVTFLAP